MINAGSGGGGGVAAFPDPPKGSPGEINAAASALGNAADELERADGGLRAASGSLASDWQGYAAAAYHTSSQALGSVARAGAEEFRECAHAVKGYASALDHTQSEMRRLKTMYDDAVRRQAAANALAGKLETSITSTTKAAAAHKLQTQITSCSTQAGDAGTEASGYAAKATSILNEFKGRASGYAATLNGAQPGQAPGPLGSPFSTAGHPGPGFGVPFNAFTLPGDGSPFDDQPVTDGLAPFNGVIPVGPDPYSSPIPGYGIYWDGRHENLTSPDDLTNLIVMVATFGAGGAIEDLGGSALKTLAREVGFGAGGREAVQEAIDEAEQNAPRGLARLEKLLDERGNPKLDDDGNPMTRLQPGRKGLGRAAGIGRQEGQQATRIGLTDQGAQLAQQAHVLPLPPAVRELIVHVAENKVVYSTAVAVKLEAARETLIRIGTPTALKAAGALGSIVAGLTR